MSNDPVCPRCRESFPRDEPDCPYCARRRKIPVYRREPVVIGGVVVVAIALWMITYFVTQAYAAREQHLATHWFDRGQAEMQAGRLPQAVENFQSALAYSHENFRYRLRLAEALAGQGHTRQAQAYLLALWDEEPGNGTVNLELARLAAQSNDVSAALRYYHGAVYGIWQNDPAARRRDARLELVDFLLQHNQVQQAQSELIALAADLPRDPALLLRVADRMRKSGLLQRALDEYRQVLAIESQNPGALAGAGQVAFALRQYSEARRYLARAVSEHTQDSSADSNLAIAEAVLQLDPYAGRLSMTERERRIVRAFRQAGERLRQCATDHAIPLDSGDSPLAADFSAWKALQRDISERALRRNPEQGDAAMDLVFRIEHDTLQLCGPGTPADQALVLVSQQREGGSA